MDSLDAKLFELSAYGTVSLSRTGRAVTCKLRPRISEIASRGIVATELALERAVERVLRAAREEIASSVSDEIDAAGL